MPSMENYIKHLRKKWYQAMKLLQNIEVGRISRSFYEIHTTLIKPG